MFLRTVSLFHRRINVFIVNDIFVMPSNLKITGRNICKWLKFNFADIVPTVKYCNDQGTWFVELDWNDINELNRHLPFHIYSLTVCYSEAHDELVLFTDFNPPLSN